MINAKPIERPNTLKALAYDRIKGLITAGELKFNIIYSAKSLGESLGVSRTPVREALMQLANEGFLTVLQGRGYKLRKISEQEVINLMEAIQVIESYIFERMMSRLTDEDLQMMEDSLNRMKKIREKDLHAFFETDKQFHMVLVNSYSNGPIRQVTEQFRSLISMIAEMVFSPRGGRIEKVITEHEEILNALHQKDNKKAVKTLVTHLDTAAKYTLKNLEKFRS